MFLKERIELEYKKLKDDLFPEREENIRFLSTGVYLRNAERADDAQHADGWCGARLAHDSCHRRRPRALFSGIKHWVQAVSQLEGHIHGHGDRGA